MWYLRDITNNGVVYIREDNRLIDIVSSDYIGDLNMRRSTIGCIFFTLGGGVISWRLMFQLTVTLFTTERMYGDGVVCQKSLMDM